MKRLSISIFVLFVSYSFLLTGCGASLTEAIKTGNTTKIRALVDKGADVNAIGKNGDTPLLFAIENGHAETVQILLERGADANYKRSIVVFRMTLPKSGTVSSVPMVHQSYWKLEHTPLSLAVQNGNLDIVRLLLDHRANPNVELLSHDLSKEERKVTPLSIAKEKGLTEMAEIITNAGAIK